ncbi:MAG: PilL N-terminal domain-containing protein [Comamonas sp.]
MLPSLPRFLCIFAVLSGLLSGCTTTPATPDHIEAPPDEIASVIDQGLIPVARYGRYTLIELVPQPAQRDLLQQAVEITIPPTLDATVGDAMRHVLLRSGYRLCDGTEAAALYALPVPAAHLHLGPLLLRDALLVLAGPAWALSVDDRMREVCFNRSADAAEVQS